MIFCDGEHHALDFIEAQAQLLKLLHELDALDGRRVEHAVSRNAACSRRQDTNPFVIANRIDADARKLSDLADLQTRHAASMPLTLEPGPDSKILNMANSMRVSIAKLRSAEQAGSAVDDRNLGGSMKISVRTPTSAARSSHQCDKRVMRRRELLMNLLAASLAVTGCKRSPRRYEVYYYYLPY